MLFQIVSFSTFCLVSMAVAFKSQPSVRLDTDTSTDSTITQNWAGAALVNKNPEEALSYVTGTFTVPNLVGNNGDTVAVWVGIDGDTCRGVVLQTGLTFIIEQNQPIYYAWCEWYPNGPITFDGISFNVGDSVRLTVEADYTTWTSGTVMVENVTQNTVVSGELSSATYPLCGQNAEWIVEEYWAGSPSAPLPLVNFGTITFTEPVASGFLKIKEGQYYTPAGATILDIGQNGIVLTSSSADEVSVTINYI